MPPRNALAPEPRNAMLRPYEPTWKEQIAAYLMGDTRPSPERRQFATGISDILGYLPGVGNVIQAQEAAKAGDTKGTIMAMLPLPGANVAAKTERNIAQGIRAYHGSPHSFERFDMSKIGTGEGAQAYGHGLYFAESEPVARSYRDDLSVDYLSDAELEAKQALEAGGWDRDKAHADLNAKIERFQENRKMFPDLSHDQSAYDAQKAEARRLIDEWSRVGNVPQNKRGSMYEVRIKANPEQFIDWDKPILEQSPEVQAILKEKFPSLFNPTVVNKYTGHPVEFFSPQTAQELEDYAQSMDFPITRPVEMLKGSSLVERLGPTPAASTEMLREAGLPGVKYFDRGSRAANEGSRNYVVFDDKIVEIMRKYGLMGPIGAGIAAKILERQQQRQEM